MRRIREHGAYDSIALESPIMLQLNLPPDLEAIVTDRVKSGSYPTVDEVVRSALYLLEDHEKLRQLKLDRLRADLAIAREQSECGEVAEMDVEQTIRQGHRRLAMKERSEG